MTQPDAVNDQHGYFINPLRGWGNDDLLASESARAQAKAENPALFRVLDWADLRATFDGYDKRAAASKKKSRHVAVGGAVSAGVGAALLAMAPLAPMPVASGLTIAALLMTVLGTLIAGYHIIQKGGRNTWMANRMKAERLRQFYFHYALANLPQLCLAMNNDKALKKLQNDRKVSLTGVLQKLEADARERPNLIVNDHTHEETWLCKIDDTGQPTDVAKLADLPVLLDRLKAQRIYIQLRYAEANRQKSIAAPAEQHATLDLICNLMTIAVVAFSIVGGLNLLTGGGHAFWLALAGASGALGITARIVQKGLYLREDVDRYDWYVEALKACHRRFESGDVQQKILALKDLEAHAYSEMRQFLRAHHRENVL